MRKLSLIVVLVAVLALPGLGFLPAQAACSYATNFAGASPNAPIDAHIARDFSTLRSSPGAPGTQVWANADLIVTGQAFLGGCLSWLEITYVSDYDGSGQYISGWTGYALESQDYFDGTYGPGTWIAPGFGPGDPGDGVCTLTNSYATGFPGPFPMTGEINHEWSTLRPSPGAAGEIIYREGLNSAIFTVDDQICLNGFSWLYITYETGVDANGKSAAGRSGWALESQTMFDGIRGPATWLVPYTNGEASS